MTPTWNNDVESNLLCFEAQTEDAGTRLDQFTATNADLTRSAAARLIEDGAVTVNGKTAAKNYKVAKGDRVEIFLPEPEPKTLYINAGFNGYNIANFNHIL